MSYVPCKTCDGRAYIECEVIKEVEKRDPDGHYEVTVGRYYGQILGRGQFVGDGVWDCPDCDEKGMIWEGEE